MRINILFMFLFSILIGTLKAQENYAKIKLGITYSAFGKNDIISSDDIVGSPSFNGDKFYSAGINIAFSQCTCMDYETGIEYTSHSVIVHPNLPPEMDNTPYSKKFYLISIPLNLKINFAKYFFFNIGILTDISGPGCPIDDQSGIGWNLGLGIKYDFKSGVSIFTNPYARYHSWISFSPGNNKQHLSETGIKFGLMYKIK